MVLSWRESLPGVRRRTELSGELDNGGDRVQEVFLVSRVKGQEVGDHRLGNRNCSHHYVGVTLLLDQFLESEHLLQTDNY